MTAQHGHRTAHTTIVLCEQGKLKNCNLNLKKNILADNKWLKVYFGCYINIKNNTKNDIDYNVDNNDNHNNYYKHSHND